MKVTLGAFETINKNQVNFGLKSKKNNVQNSSTLNLGASDFVYSKNASEALKTQNVAFGTALPNCFFNLNRRRVNNTPNFIVSAEVRHYLNNRAEHLRSVNDVIARNINNNNENSGELIQEPRLANNAPSFFLKQRFLKNIKSNLVTNVVRLMDKEPKLARNLSSVLLTIRLDNPEDIKRNEGKLYLIQHLDKFHEGNMDKAFRFSNNLINETFFNNNSFILSVNANEGHTDSSIYVVPKEGNNEVVGFKIGDLSLGNVGLVEFDINDYGEDGRFLDHIKIEAKDGAKISGIKIDKLFITDIPDILLDVQNSTLNNVVEIASYMGFGEDEHNIEEGDPCLLRVITDGSANLKLNNDLGLPKIYGVLDFRENSLYMEF